MPTAPSEGPSSQTVTGEGERRKLASRAGIVGLGTLASRVLGLVRDMAIAALFTRAQTDAFWSAFVIPNVLRQLLAEGAVSSAVVPVLSGRIAKDGDAAARSFFARVRALSLLALTVVTVLGVVFAGPLTELFAGGYHAVPGQFERTASLTRLVFPYIFFMGTAALGMAALNAKGRFAVPAFAPALLNVAMVACAFALRGPLMAYGIDGVMALGVGALAGGVLQVVAQWPALRRIGFADRPVLDLRDPHVREVLRRIVPMTAGIGIYSVDLAVSGYFLSSLGVGPRSYFSMAMRLCEFPQGIFVMAISTAALPSLAKFAAQGDKTELAKTWAHGMRLSLLVAVPASVALVVLGEPIVAMLFQKGEFDAFAVHETARALVWQGGATFTVAAVRQLVSAFHATGDTRTPVVVSAVDFVVFLVLAWTLKGPFGHVGISIAVAGSSLAQMVMLFLGLRKRLGTLHVKELAASTIRIFVASAVAAGGGWGAARLFSDGPTWLAGMASILAFATLFLVVAWGVGVAELAEVTGPIRRRLRGRV